MFCLDIETLSQKSDAVVLSLAILYFEDTDKASYEELLERTLFVKFSIKEQIEVYNRKYAKDTINWWKKQCQMVREVSIESSPKDVPLRKGIELVKEYINKHSSENDIVWTRGSLDQFCIDSVCEESLKIPVLFHYNRYMDMRTAINLLRNTSKNGYCDINGFDTNKVYKHNPVHDVAYDVMMLLYGE